MPKQQNYRLSYTYLFPVKKTEMLVEGGDQRFGEWSLSPNRNSHNFFDEKDLVN